jgi:hypothetical protein
MLDDVIGVAGVVHPQARAPFRVTHQRCSKLGIVRQVNIIG